MFDELLQPDEGKAEEGAAGGGGGGGGGGGVRGMEE